MEYIKEVVDVKHNEMMEAKEVQNKSTFFVLEFFNDFLGSMFQEDFLEFYKG